MGSVKVTEMEKKIKSACSAFSQEMTIVFRLAYTWGMLPDVKEYL